MNTALYHSLQKYAASVLPAKSILEPADLVTEAWLQTGTTDLVQLKFKIRSLAFAEVNRYSGQVHLMDVRGRYHRALEEKTKHCYSCKQEKGINDFYFIPYGLGCRSYRRECKTCYGKRNKARDKATGKADSAERKEKQKLYNRRSYERLKADPIRYQEWLRKERIRQQNRKNQIPTT